MTSLLLAALIAVESGGDVRAVGDGGRAHGVLQIHPAVVADVNRIAGARYTLADRWCPVKAEAMWRVYLSHYASAERLGRAATAQDYARIWNGGPNGHRKASTLRYWRRVEALLVSSGQQRW